MKKIILLLTTLVSLLSADIFVGANLGYGNISAEASTATSSASANSKYTSLEFKAGYEFKQARLLGFIGLDKYADDMIYVGEKAAKYYGVEGDFLIEANEKTNLYVGVAVAKGNKDFVVVEVDTKDVAFKAGALIDLEQDMQLEVGIQYKKRDYDETMGISMDDSLVGVFVGLNFML